VSAPNGQSTSFTYDFAGNLIQQKDAGPTSNLTQTFLLDSLTNVAFVNRSDGDSYSVLAGRSIDDHVAAVHTSGQIEYGLTDALNSTVVTADHTGAIKGRFTYEPFGQTTASNSSYAFQHTGRVPVGNDLYYYRARYYNTQTGRFLSQDPIGLAGGDVDLYRYSANSFIGTTDPLGLLNKTQLASGVISLAGAALTVAAAALAPVEITVATGIVLGAVVPAAVAFGMVQMITAFEDVEASGSVTDVVVKDVFHMGDEYALPANILVDIVLGREAQAGAESLQLLADILTKAGYGVSFYDIFSKRHVSKSCGLD
jgi:RHS repeat-associated protein